MVIKTEERNNVLTEISARAAKISKWDPDQADELMQLRKQVKDVFDKGLQPGDDIMEQLWFLDSKSRDVVEKMTREYNDVITPDDFAQIGNLMTEHMATRVPILTDFTKFFGRLSQDFLITAKPSKAEFDLTLYLRKKAFGEYKGGTRINPFLGRLLGIDYKAPLTEQMLKRIPGYSPNSLVADILLGVKDSGYRPTGKKFGIKLKAGDIYTDVDIAELGLPNKQPKSWTHAPWVNFDGKILEQHYTQRFEEKLVYKNAQGEWITNIIQVDQRSDPTWFEELMNKGGKINDIVDSVGARTAFAVNGNHSEHLL